ncbi:MAG: DUF58 domain-containing protein, partial [bacterium]|nr:DUF58 domain-containing protein [bacterium]
MPLFVLGIFIYPLLLLGLALDIFLLLAAIIDYRPGVKSNSLSFTPGGSTFFSIGKKNHITFTIRNKGDLPLIIDVKTDLPHSWETPAESSAVSIGPHGKSELIVEYRPLRRGVYCLKYIHYRCPSPSGLVFIHRKEEINLEIEVFPDVKEVNRYLMMSRRNKLYELGIHRNRFQGMGTNLEFLRDYQMDDDSKRIDWKASTRNNKLVTKVFQMESNNLIAIVL